jgi:hypothetical protein
VPFPLITTRLKYLCGTLKERKVIYGGKRRKRATGEVDEEEDED